MTSQPEFRELPGELPRTVLVACRVFEGEIALHARGASHIVETRFLEMGLHDRPRELRGSIQAILEELDGRDDLEAVALAYGLCGNGTAGLGLSRHRLILPRAHDCIALFMGSAAAAARHGDSHPACHYYTPGWNRGRRVPGPDRLESLERELRFRFDADQVGYLLEVERAQWTVRDTAVFIDLGTPDAGSEAAYARRCAEWLGWKFDWIRGDPRWLKDLIWGRWDEARFRVIPAGAGGPRDPDPAAFSPP
ncbi:MAG: DUF1638 domain-containing protein [Verrucomicrobiota bacterium]